MITSILIGVGGGLLLELLGLGGAGGTAASLGKGVPVLLRLVRLTRGLRGRMTDEERREADAAAEEAERIVFGRR